MPSILSRLQERKLFQWGLTYLAGAWAVLEAVGFASDTFGWPVAVSKTLTILAVAGFAVTLVVAWYHGEKGRQRVSGPELLILAMLFVLAGLVLKFLGGEQDGSETSSVATSPIPEETEYARVLRDLPGIAVLPFANRSTLLEDQYFTDGFHDEVLTRLQRIPGLRVVSRTSVEAFRDSPQPVRDVAHELGVDYVLEGGVQRGGAQVRINLQLIDAREDGHLWAETYDRILTPQNLFEVQSEIVRRVAQALDLTLREEDLRRAARRSTSDLEAYDLFIRGREREYAGDRSGAADYYDLAAARDPEFLLAYATAAGLHGGLYSTERSEERAAATRRAALKAVELDAESPDAQLAMADYLTWVEKDWPQALDWVERAMRNLRGDADYQNFRANLEAQMGHWRDAVASFEAAIVLSPGLAGPRRGLGFWLSWMRRYDEAETWLVECQEMSSGNRDPSVGKPFTSVDPRTCFIDLGHVQWMRGELPEAWRDVDDPYVQWELRMASGDYPGAIEALGSLEEAAISQYRWYPLGLLAAWAYEGLGDERQAREGYLDAVRILEPLRDENPSDERFHHALGLSYAGLGRRSESLEEATTATELLPPEKDRMRAPFHIVALAAVHARLGDTAEALSQLERVLTMPARFSGASLREHYMLRPLHDDPEFLALLEREPGRVF